MENSSYVSLPGTRSGLSAPIKQLLTALGGAAICFVGAVLLHYLWDLSGHLLPAALFASVNESVWEHIKILCWPFLFWGIAEYYILRPSAKRMVIARTIAVTCVALLTLCFFYIYTGVLGSSVVWVDISSAAVWLLCGELITMRVLNAPPEIDNWFAPILAWLALTIVALLCFTASPPHIGLFRDPVTGLYGLEKMP